MKYRTSIHECYCLLFMCLLMTLKCKRSCKPSHWQTLPHIVTTKTYRWTYNGPEISSGAFYSSFQFRLVWIDQSECKPPLVTTISSLTADSLAPSVYTDPTGTLCFNSMRIKTLSPLTPSERERERENVSSVISVPETNSEASNTEPIHTACSQWHKEASNTNKWPHRQTVIKNCISTGHTRCSNITCTLYCTVI